MRAALRASASPAALVGYAPPPIKGWNANKDIVDLDDTEAYMLENWFPDSSSIEVRKGSKEHVTGFGAAVESLMAYSGGATDKLFAASGTAIYDATSAGAVGAAVVSSTTNARWQYVNFGTSAGNYLLCCNGAKTPQIYDGTNWADVGFTGTGLTLTNLIHVNVYKRRLFWVESGTLTFWYMNADTITGAGTAFAFHGLKALCRKGGYLMAMGTWTRDGGAGIDDYAVFITSNGEVAIYSGSDPSTADDWFLVGVFDISPPLGRRCFLKFGGELIVSTLNGYYPLSRAIASSGVNQNAAISNSINGAVEEEARSFATTYGWQPILYQKGSRILFNVPHSSTVFVQHVLNTNTGAWCKFTGMNARCWEVHQGNLYFGGLTAVYLADDGYADARVGSASTGTAIEAEARLSFNYFRRKGQLKVFTLIRPLLQTDGVLTIQYAMNTDFAEDASLTSQVVSSGSGSPWGLPWGFPWATTGRIIREWVPASGMGYNGSLRIKTSVNGNSLAWRGTDVQFVPGGNM